MADSNYRQYGGGDLESETKNVFEQGMHAMAESEARGDKPVKLFGLMEVPAGAVVFANIAYNALSKLGSDQIQQPIYEGVHKLLGKHLAEGKVGKVAAATTFAASFGLKAGGYVVPIVTGVFDQHKELATAAKDIAPVLDELKGNHSQLALMMVNASDNSVIAAHKSRMDKIYGSRRMQNLTQLVFNAGANIMLDVRQGVGMWKHGMSPDQVAAGLHKTPTNTPVLEGEDARIAAMRTDKSGQSKQMLEYMWGTGGAGLAEIFTASSKRKQKALIAKPSAFEMLVALDQQMTNNPNVRIQAPGEHRDYSLEAYIMKTMLVHQQEMSDMDSHYTAIRPALREELGELVKPMAEAIREGIISPLTLMHLIGEPQKFPVIRNKGRALATSDEVETMIEKLVGKKSNTRIVDVDDFMAKHDLKIENLKKALGILQGDERLKITSLFPDSVLDKAGVNAEEMKHIQGFRSSPEYDTLLAQMATVVAQTEEKALKHGGLTSRQIKRLDDAAQTLRSDTAAIKDLKNGFTNADGIEHDLIDWAIPQLEGGAIHLGKITQRAQELMSGELQPMTRSFNDRVAQERGGSNPADELADELDEGKHTSRQKNRRERSAGHEMGFDN